MKEKIILELNINEFNIIAESLVNMPYGKVVELINNLIKQKDDQINEMMNKNNK